MHDYVWLELRRNRGYPWPEDSYGLDPMYGPDGWCRSCGVPQKRQQGSLVLQRRSRSKFDGAWVPNWLFDAVCMSDEVAKAARERFELELMPVEWKGPGSGEAWQIIPRVVDGACFDPSTLKAAAVAKHGGAGRACPECGIWRWFPLGYRELPVVSLPDTAHGEVLACPEWFGDGWKSFRLLLFSRPLGEFLVEASPRDFRLLAADVK